VKIAVVGSEQDVGGFALAGLPGRVVESGPGVEAALRAAGEEESAGLLLVSAETARAASEVLERIARREGAPVVLALPEGAP